MRTIDKGEVYAVLVMSALSLILVVAGCRKAREVQPEPKAEVVEAPPAEFYEPNAELEKTTDVHKIDSSIPAIIVFTENNCPECRRIEPEIKKLQDQECNVYEINVDLSDNAAIGKRLNVKRFPTIILFENKVEDCRKIGFRKAEDIRAMFAR